MAIEKWGNPKLVFQAVTGSSDQSTVTALPNGGYVVVWRNGTFTSVQVLNGLGDPVGARKDIASPAGASQFPKVTALVDGGFVVVWESASKTVQAQEFSVLGVPVGDLVPIAVGDTGRNHSSPSVAADANGWAAVWSEDNSAASGVDRIWFKRKDESAFSVAAGSGVTKPAVAALKDGSHAVTWAIGNHIKVALVSQNNVVTVLADQNQPSSVSGALPSITALSNGGFVVSWLETNADRISTQVYNSSGVPVPAGSFNQVGTEINYPPQVVALTKGGFQGGYAIVHMDDMDGVGTGNDNGNIYLRLVKANGEVVGPTLINDGTLQSGDQLYASVTELPDGRISVVWRDGSSGSGAIRNQIIDAREIAVTVEGTLHNDIYVGSKHAGDRLYGNAGNDALYGGDGQDSLYGGNDNDTLDGGAGDDLLYSGHGSDQLKGGIDYDWVDYSHSAEAVTANLSTRTGKFGDAEGDTYEEIENLAGSDKSDTLIGDNNGNWLAGGNGDDTLNGGAGDDNLNGDEGSDRFYGGAGADTINGGIDNAAPVDWDDVSYQTATAAIRLDLSDASGASNLGDAKGDRFEQIEAYVGSRFNDVMIGKAGWDTFFGDAGNDLLQGGTGDGSADYLNGQAGDDTLEGGVGGDQLIGGEGFDFASYANAAAIADGVGVHAWLFPTDAGRGEARGDGYTEIEGLIGSAHHDSLVGNDGANELRGGASNDWLEGELAGGAVFGSDTLEGGSGADTLHGGAGAGIVDFASYASAGLVDGRGVFVSLNRSDSDRYTGDAASDELNGIEGLIGSAHADTLVGDANANILRGGGGNDALNGGAGNDTLDGGAGLNTAVYAGARDDYTITRNANGSLTVIDRDGSEGTDTLIGVRYFQFNGVAEVFNAAPTGLQLSNASIVENAPNRAVVGTLSATDLDRDTLTYSLAPGSSSAFAIDPDSNSLVVTGPLDFESQRTHQVTIQAKDAYGGVTSLTVNVTVTNAVETTPFTIRGTPQADRLTGEAGNDTIYGSGANDVVSGEAGADRLHGGTGNDQLSGGAGKDVFVFDMRMNKRTNVDKIGDFRYQDDSLWLENKYFTKLGAGTASKPKKFSADMFVQNTKAQDAEDRIIYDKRSGKLYYDEDGTGAKAQIHIATLTNKATLKYSDLFVI